MHWKYKCDRRFLTCDFGATAIEVSLILLPFLIFVLGTIEVSRFYFSKHELSQLANEVVRSYLIRYSNALANDVYILECWSSTEWAEFVDSNVVLLQPGRLSLSEFSGLQDGCPFFDGATLKAVKFQLDYDFNFLTNFVGTAGITLTEYRTFDIELY